MAIRETRADVVVIGGGIAGLTLGAELGGAALVLEAEDRPGGLVRTEHVDGYWFDHVLHLLHLGDADVEAYAHALLGEVLGPCPPVAVVHVAGHEVAYPFQFDLAALPADLRAACVRDFVAASRAEAAPRDYGEQLRALFGATMCELFYEPYNRKQWQRPLTELATSGFQWNLQRPSVEEVETGARDGVRRAYNANGWYPRPPAGAPVRGMEVLSAALAARVHRLALGARVRRIDPAGRTVTYEQHGAVHRVAYGRLVSTAPLPLTAVLTAGLDPEVGAAVAGLAHTRVRSVGIGLRGERPAHDRLWEYHPDPALPFTRLVHMTNFDPLCAPDDGWALLAEVPEDGRFAARPDDAVVADVLAGLRRLGTPGEVVVTRVVTADPAYVVFGHGTADVVARARAALAGMGVETLGRYGRWEYSSMAQAMGDALALAGTLADEGAGEGAAG